MMAFLFTIEQIELIRRLRASGITKEQVIMAFDQLERLDSEFGKTSDKLPPSNSVRNSHYSAVWSQNSSSPNMRTSASAKSMLADAGLNETSPGGKRSSSVSGVSGASGEHVQNGTAKNDSNQSMHPGGKPSEALHSTSTSSNDSTMDGCNAQNGESSSPHHPSSISSPTSKLPSELTIIPISSAAGLMPADTSPNQDLLQRVGDGGIGLVPLQCLVNPHDFLQEETNADVEDLKRKGEAAILSEIRNFVMRYNIKQTMIAEMTKLSQAYVSRFFRGDIADMSDRTKNTFYMWYLTCKNNPWRLGMKRMVSESGDLIPLKRERFTFKSAHLAVLERYYERDPYPDAQTREQIVEECNKAVERPERVLTEREKVTLPVVNNWFNNRRKEAKKQLRQQHAAAMAAAASASSASLQSPGAFPMGAQLAATLAWGANMLPPSTTATSAATTTSSQSSSSCAINSQLDLGSETADSDTSHDSSLHYSAEEALIMDFTEGQKVTVKQETVS